MTTDILRREPLRRHRRFVADALARRNHAPPKGIAELFGAAMLFIGGAAGIALRVFLHTPA